MGETQVKGVNVGDGSVGRPDLNIATAGQAVIRQILEVANSGIKIASFTGIDKGTGDVGLTLDLTYLATLYQAKLNGTGLVRMTGTSVAYDNTTYYHTGNLPVYPTRAYPCVVGGGDLNFNWSGLAGQPTWLWGGNDPSAIYVYNPSNFSVNYAASAGSANTANTFSSIRTGYKNITDEAVAGQLMWKNYGNGHTVFDASNSTSPQGTAINNTNSVQPWNPTYPTLMGWNGDSTYGVRVDSCRIADSVANADTVDGYHANQLQFYQSVRDFTVGTLIKSSIDYSQTSGDPFLLEIEGNSYSGTSPFDLKVEGYIYGDTIIAIGGISNGFNLTGLVALNVGGKLCFWFPRHGYWQGFSVFIASSNPGIKNNKWVSTTDEAKPAGTKEVALSPGIKQSWHSGNLNHASAPFTASNYFIGAKQMLSNYSMNGANNNIWIGSVNTTLAGTGDEGNYNVGIGDLALGVNTTGHENVAIGVGALKSNTSGSWNYAIGVNALRYNTTGVQNMAVGGYALASNTTGGYNLALGVNTLKGNISGSYNTGVGYCTLYVATGNNNTAVGFYSGFNISTGTENTGIGVASNFGLTTGIGNTVIGYGTLRYNAAGGYNVAIGWYAGRYLNDGTNNTGPTYSVFIGDDCRGLNANDENQIVIGHLTIGHGSNTATWGNTVITHHYFSGAISATGSGTFDGGGFNSLRSLKKIHKDWTGDALSAISKFKVRDFNYKTRPGYDRTLGFIVDEIPEEISDYILLGKERNAVNTYSLHALSFLAHQETKTELELQDEEILTLKSRVKELEEGRAN